MPSPADAGLPNPAQYDFNTVPGVVIDKVTGLSWQQPVDANQGYVTQAEAASYCAALSLNGGGWRLPTRIELVSIWDYTSSTNIDQTAFPATPAQPFWTASVVADHGGASWWIVKFDLSDSKVSYQPGTITGATRCVR